MNRLLLKKWIIPSVIMPHTRWRPLFFIPIRNFTKDTAEDFLRRMNQYGSSNQDNFKEAEKQFKEKKFRKQIKEKFNVKRDEEEIMRKRFVRNRDDAEFTRKAEREFKKKSITYLWSKLILYSYEYAWWRFW